MPSTGDRLLHMSTSLVMSPPPTESESRPDGPEAFVARVARELMASDGRPILFILGSGVSNAVIPGVGRSTVAALDLLAKQAPEAMGQVTAAYAVKHADAGSKGMDAIIYERILRLVDSFLGPEAVKGFVQELTLQAYTAHSPEAHAVLAGRARYDPLADDECQTLEDDIAGWRLPLGLTALGVLAAQHPKQLSRAITTNFDPLLEIAVQAAGRDARSLPFDRDGALDTSGSRRSFGVAHLHGYWEGATHTLHTARRLTEPRPRLADSLRELMTDAVVVVTGYGGQNDIFSGALRAVIAEHSNMEVIWTLLDRRPDRWPPGTLMDELDHVGTGVHIYDGVDAHVVLPQLAALCNADPVERLVALPSARRSSSGSQARSRLQAAIEDGDLGLVSSPGSAGYPDVVVWPHRLREPNVTHAGQAAVARALLEGGSRVLVLINDLGGSRDPDALARLQERIRAWTTDGLATDRLIVQMMRDRNVLVPRNVSYERMREVLELAIGTVDVARVLSHATEDSFDLQDGIWHRLLGPFVYWTYVLTLQERGVPLQRIWTLSGDHYDAMWRDFDEKIAQGAAHLLVPVPRDRSDPPRALVDGPVVRDSSAFAEALASRPRDGFDQSGRLASWACRNLLALPARLAGTAVEPIATSAGELRDLAGLMAALETDEPAEIAEQVAAGIWGRFF